MRRRRYPDRDPEIEDDSEGTSAPAPDPWERLPGEPSEAWELFSRYVLSSAPSIARFAAEVGTHSRPALAALAARWRWLARRDALTWHLHREAVLGASEEAHAQGAAHARATAAGLDWAVESMAARRAAGELLEPREIVAMAKAMIELQRVAAGEPTARTAVDLSHVDDDGLAKIRAAIEGAIGGAAAGAPEN